MENTKPEILIEGKIRLTDNYFEENYSRIIRQIKNNKKLILDFRFIKWFDLWPLMQILLLLKYSKDKEILVRIIDPNHYSRSEEVTNIQRENSLARIKFLVDSGFISNALDQAFIIVLSNPFAEIRKEISNLEELKSLFPEIIAIKSLDVRPLIPITSIENLKNLFELKQLFSNFESILKNEFSDDPHLIKSGLSDCIIQELIENVKAHASNKGFIALRASIGLNLYDSKFKFRKALRLSHPLGDWKDYFNTFLDESYLELIVTDFGDGITGTIQDDAEFPKELKKIANISEQRHKILEYSLTNYSSKYSKKERTKQGLSDLTGLGALKHVIKENSGSILIREGNSRHIFNMKKDTGSFFENTPNINNFDFIKGTTVTCVIPRSKCNTKSLSSCVLSKELPYQSFDFFKDFKCSIYKIIQNGNRNNIDKQNKFIELRWDEIQEELKDISNSLLIIDLKDSSIYKNELWSGFLEVLEISLRKKNFVFYMGVTERTIFRLKDYLEIEKMKFKKKKNWFSFALSDTGHFYCIGLMNDENSKNDKILNKIANSFFYQCDINPEIFEKFFLDFSNPFIQQNKFTFSLTDVWSYFYSVFKNSILMKLKDSNIFLNNEIIELQNREQVEDFILLNSIPQISEIFPYLNRLVSIISYQFEFNFIMSFGVNPYKIVLDLHSELILENKFNMKYKSYLDYFHLDFGESNSEEITENENVLLLLNVVRSGENCSEVINHIKSLDAKIPIIISLFYLSDGEIPNVIQEVPFFPIFVTPVHKNTESRDAEKKFNPFLGIITKNEIAPYFTPSIKDMKKTYLYLEQYNLIRIGHFEYNDRHFHTVIDFQYLIDGSSFLKSEILFEIDKILDSAQPTIDTILFPGHTNTLLLINFLKKNIKSRKLNFIMATSSYWPGNSRSYELDDLSIQQLNKSKGILIIDDQIITGKTIKNLFSLCLINNIGDLRTIRIFVIVNSLEKSEIKIFKSFIFSDGYFNKSDLNIKLISFFNLSLLQSLNKSQCPFCNIKNKLQKLMFENFGIVEKIYTKNRIKSLKIKSLNSSYALKYEPIFFNSPLHIKTRYKNLQISFFTEEALILFIEEIYSDGEIFIIIDEFLNDISVNFKYLSSNSIINIIRILSRDLMILSQVQIKEMFHASIINILDSKKLELEDISYLFEIVSEWPLYYIEKILHRILLLIQSIDSDDLIIILPGIELLFLSILSREKCNLKTIMLSRIRKKLNTIAENLLKKLSNLKENIKAHIILNLINLLSIKLKATQSLSVIISDLSFLIGYFIPEKQVIHSALMKGLEQIGDSIREDKVREYIYTIEMLNHFRTLYNISVINYGIFTDSRKHSDYLILDSAIEEILKIFPKDLDEDISDIQDDLKIKARSILDILYKKKDHGSFKDILAKELQSYRMCVNDILNNYFDIENVKKKLVQKELIQIKDLTYLTLNEEYCNLIFGEIKNNLNNENDSLNSEDKYTQRELHFGNIEIELDGKNELDSFVFTIQSTISEESMKKIKENTIGLGIPQISKYSEQLGIRYEFNFITRDQKQWLEQKLVIRRFFI